MDTACCQSNCERNGMLPASDGLRAGEGSARCCVNVIAPDNNSDPFRANIAHREKSTRVAHENIIFRNDVMIFRSEDIIFRGDVMIFRSDVIINRGE